MRLSVARCSPVASYRERLSAAEEAPLSGRALLAAQVGLEEALARDGPCELEVRGGEEVVFVDVLKDFVEEVVVLFIVLGLLQVFLVRGGATAALEGELGEVARGSAAPRLSAQFLWRYVVRILEIRLLFAAQRGSGGVLRGRERKKNAPGEKDC